MTRRSEFPAKVKVEAWKRAEGKCAECTAPIWPGNGPEYDHRIPDAMGGKPTIENCVVLCKPCHGRKTAKADAPQIAKAKRRERSHINVKAPRSIIPGSKASPFKRLISGQTVRREP